MRRDAQAGFTLLEVVVAVGIIAVALMALLELHMKAMQLYDRAISQQLERDLLARAVAMTELDVVAGTTAGEGDFGERYPDYVYTFEALQMSDDLGLFEVLLIVSTPEDEPRELAFYVYDMK
jgi:prepilin-type N-terminal cleavage/methylation domain-containing protein